MRIRLGLCFILLASAWALAQDKPGAPGTRRPVHDDTERTQYPRRRALPTVAEAQTEQRNWLRREFYPDLDDAGIQAEIDSLYQLIESVERDPRKAADLAKRVAPVLRSRVARRENGGPAALAPIFRFAGVGAETAYRLQRPPDDGPARRMEAIYELFRSSTFYVLREANRDGDVAEEPFTRVERARLSDPERTYRDAFLEQYRRASP